MKILSLISGLLPNFVKGVAEGQYGEGLKKVYWALSEKKTVTALIITMLYGIAKVVLYTFAQCVPECATAESVAQMEAFLTYVPELVGVLIAVGLFDKAVRLDPPKKD